MQVIDVLAAIRDLKNDYPTTYKGNRLVKQKEIVYGQLACERSWILNYNIHYQKVKSKDLIELYTKFQIVDWTFKMEFASEIRTRYK